ncbi:hypothetical protein LWI29_010417 [Acer saccharum]|uniref:Uncharacterized protein n=1 Tax=Acer saccharum TaxID=4024 RepID=A0AA39SBX5_ACESA|nr:hypothetical protein LWI29_010417 [Acer saccharum]
MMVVRFRSGFYADVVGVRIWVWWRSEDEGDDGGGPKMKVMMVGEKLKLELSREDSVLELLPQPVKQRMADEILQRLHSLDAKTNVSAVREKDILPGRPVPPECNAELHTDYAGAAVRWVSLTLKKVQLTAVRLA